MSTTYQAVYRNAMGREYPATVFLSSVTLTLRIVDESNHQRDIYWLAERADRLEATAFDHRLFYHNLDGQTDILIIRDAALLEAIRKQFKSYRLSGGWYYRFFGTARKKLAVLATVFLSFLLAFYFLLIPWIGERIAMNFSKEYETELGNQLYSATITGYTVDTGRTRILNEFYNNLHYSTGYPVQVTVVESEEVNAFAIPGGHIIVHSAILESMKTPEELAALLGHEASHIAKRHSLRNLFRSLGRKLFITLLFGGDSGILSAIAGNADELKGLQYSRELETEADTAGLQLMVKSGIRPEGMLHLMQLLETSTGGQEPASFLSTHPVFEDRKAHIREQIRQLPQGQPMPDVQRQLFHAIYE